MDFIEANRLAMDELVALREYRTTEPVRAFVKYLDALAEQYKLEFESVTPENLVKLQTALRQVRALRDAVQADGPTTAKIL